MKLEFLGKVYDLELTTNKYITWDRTYYWLVDKNDWEPFCDLSENHPEISDKLIYGWLPWHEAIIIDNDFLSCFDEPRLAKIWIKENIKDCVITGTVEWRDCFYIKTKEENADSWDVREDK